jgi:hypothetical protein
MTSAPTLSSCVTAGVNVLFQELQGEAVLLDLNSGMYFGLDAVGTRVWQLIAEDGRLEIVLRAMVAEFDVSEEQCTVDLIALVAQLKEQGLVTIS